MRRGVALSALVAAFLVLPSCMLAYRPQATVTPIPEPPPVEISEAPPAPTAAEMEEPEPPTGIFHVVQAGQTLWRIARAYGTTVDSLAAANAIADPERLEVGQAIFVPDALGAVDVPPYPAPIPEMPPTPTPPPSPGFPRSPDGYVWPVAGEVIAPFGQRRRRSVHRGIDIRGAAGDEVLAARAGRVVFSGTQRGYGRVVVLDHGDGEQTVYAHNSRNLVAAGDEVERGARVAQVGRSGNATTEHVHFEVRRGGVPVDPMPFLPESALEAKK